MKNAMRVVALAVPLLSTTLPASVFMYWTGEGPLSQIITPCLAQVGVLRVCCRCAVHVMPACLPAPGPARCSRATPAASHCPLPHPHAASNVFSLGQTSLLKIPAVKKALGLPDLSKLRPAAKPDVGKPVQTFAQPPRQAAAPAAAAPSKPQFSARRPSKKK